MFNRMMWSKLALVIAIAASTLCYLWIGFDSIGEPMFEHQTYALLLSSLVLPLLAGTWYRIEGNDADSALPTMFWGYGIGAIMMIVWLWMLTPTLSAAGTVFLIFGFPMVIASLVYAILLGFALTLGFGIAYVWGRITQTHHVTHL